MSRGTMHQKTLLMSARALPKSRSSAPRSKVPARGKAPREGFNSTINFSVDASLLRELGERLVGRPHIALAELIKNSYDADARHVRVSVETNRLIVEDDGYGMTFAEFRDFWMRIGTPHKQEEAFSRELRRALTGSKGIGRLAVQFLGRRLAMSTTAKKPAREVRASVDWNRAVNAGDLTAATAAYTIETRPGTYVGGSRHGTRIEITSLNDVWEPDTLRQLAQEIWSLQPPYGAQDESDPRSFSVDLQSSNEQIKKAFEERVKANLNLWSARVRGELLQADSDDPKGTRIFSCVVQFRNSRAERYDFPIKNCTLDRVNYDVRIFSLFGRQRFNINVDEARKYLRDYGGVHIYDAGFHLPYYGATTDWLNIEFDHAHRLSVSQYLPPELNVVEGLNNLPTTSRIYGVVNIDTSHERRAADEERTQSGKFLQIQISRDRLVDNLPYRQLIFMIRQAIDLYAMRETTRRLTAAEEAFESRDVANADLRDVDDLLSAYANRIPPDVLTPLRTALHSSLAKADAFRSIASAEIGLLGSLASAGINVLSLEHESNRELTVLESLASEISELRVSEPAIGDRLHRLVGELRNWIERARATRAILSPLLDEEDRGTRSRFFGRDVVASTADRSAIFTRGIPITYDDLDPAVRLPPGTLAEWNTIFQNVIINATNALLDVDRPHIDISSTAEGSNRSILVQDNGSGVDLRNAERLFRPFARAAPISPERRALGLGGTGLGLSIVRMIANSLDTRVAFVAPGQGFSTAFQLSWTES